MEAHSRVTIRKISSSIEFLHSIFQYKTRLIKRDLSNPQPHVAAVDSANEYICHTDRISTGSTGIEVTMKARSRKGRMLASNE